MVTDGPSGAYDAGFAAVFHSNSTPPALDAPSTASCGGHIRGVPDF